MRKTLFTMAVLAAFGASAAITAPEAGKVYCIQNASGLYMTAENNGLYLHAQDASDRNQHFEFVPVAGSEGVYNIRMANDLFIGTDGNWTVMYSNISENTYAQYRIVASEADADCVRFVNVETEKGLGCDKDTEGSATYTDKDDSKETFRWKIALAPELISVAKPKADRYYRIRHASGLYLTDTRFSSKIENRKEDNTQIYQFVPVEGQEDVYAIRRVNSGMFVGSNLKWSSVPVSRSVAQSQHRIVVAEDTPYVVFQNMAMADDKNCMGSDETAAGSAVYTDKSGTDASLHRWFIEEAAKYEEAIPEGLTNLVANGDFEDAGYVQEVNAESEQMTLSVLPGWNLEESDKWNGAHAIEDVDGVHHLVLAGYMYDGWADVAANQEIAVVAGHNYALTFDYQNDSEGNMWSYKVSDANGTLAEASSPLKDKEWKSMTVRFRPTADKVTIRFALNSNKSKKKQNLRVNNVALVDVTPEDFYAEYEAPKDERANAYDGYRLVFAQEFSEDGTPDHDIWNFEEGFKRNNEDQYYNGDKNCYIKDGVLVIEGRHVLNEQIKNPKYDPFNKAWPSKIGKYLTWTSGSMQTKGPWDGGYSWNFGIYEVRAKVPQYVGSWPAIWSTGKSHEWPYGGEIDIMEYYGHCIHANVCWGDGKRWAGHWNSATVHDNVLGAGWGDEYHIWRMVWDYDHMELWCDDILVNNIDLDTTNNDKYTAGDIDDGDGCNPFRDVRQMLWLNLALGGNNGGSLANTPRPLRYLIDYARVYQKIGTDGKATYAVDEETSEPTFKIKDGQTEESAAIENVSLGTTEAVSGVYNLQGIRVADSIEALSGKEGRQVYIVVKGNEARRVVL